MDDVGAARAVEVVDHAAREHLDDLGELLLPQGRATGVDVHDTKAGLDEHLVGQVGLPASDVRRGVDPGLGEG